MPTSAVRCVNRECELFNEPRVARMVEVGDGLFARPPVLCVCGGQVATSQQWVPDVETRPVTPAEIEAKARPRNSSKRPPERRG